MQSENLADRVRRLKGLKEALELELKLAVDELAEVEGRLKAEQSRAMAVEAACRASSFMIVGRGGWLSISEARGCSLRLCKRLRLC